MRRHVSGSRTAARGAVTGRIHPLDWLRVLALLGVFVYHTLRPFDTANWHVKNARTSEVVTVLLTSFIWGLALFFLLAGAGSSLALRWRTPGGYLRERLLRLGVPLVTGYLLFAPVQAFVQETHFGRYGGSFPDFLPVFARTEWGQVRDGLDFPLMLPWAGHLWFLVFLLWFSVLALPLLVLFRMPVGRRAVDRLGRHAGHRGAVLMWAVPLALIHAGFRAPGTVEHGWGEFLVFFDCFLAGALLFSDTRLIDAVRRDLWPALTLAVAVTVPVGAVLATGVADRWPDDPWLLAARSFVLTGWVWGWMMVALAVGLRVPRFQRPLPPAVGAAAMPFFLVHQPVILAVAYVVVRWDAGIPVKWLALIAISLPVSVALAAGIASTPYLSVLFGVKRRTRSRTPAAAVR